MRKQLFTLLLSLMALTSYAQIPKLGDLNHDNSVNVSDVTTLVDIILKGYSPFSVSPEEVAMQIGGTANVTISGGYDNYEVETADPNIVTASLNGLTVTLTAIAGGETTVTVKDVLTYRTIDIPVVVEYDPLQLAADDLSLISGERGTVGINSGSGYYSVESSDTLVAKAMLSGNTVKVTAVGAGNASITITDNKTNQSKVIAVTVMDPLELSTTKLKLVIEDVEIVDITSGNGNYNIQSSDATVATAVIDGSTVVITALAVGTATITVTDALSGLTATIKVTVEEYRSYTICPDNFHPHLIDLDLPSGTKWSCCNLGAVTPEGSGDYYAWGETYLKSAYTWGTYSLGNASSCQDIGSDIAGTQYDAAHFSWRDPWVMPSLDQIAELFQYCHILYATKNGVDGETFTGDNGGQIFLPFAGLYDGSELYYNGDQAHYWSSTKDPNDSTSAYGYSSYFDYLTMRYLGKSIRPVDRK